MDETDFTAMRRHPRALTPRSQVAIVLGAALAAAVGLGVGTIAQHFGETEPASQASQQEKGGTAAPAAPAGFRLTKAELANTKIAPVAMTTFRAEHVTDGKIALNAERTTPVFSPYSGRVTKLYASLGDHVKQGAPLFAIEASEFVQGQNDLITAAAALNKAKSALNLAQINEKRQHELFDARAGALKDWEQAQSDLAGAQSDERSAEIALAAVRNRLRILGKSDAEIGALETAQRMDPAATVLAPIAGTVTDRQVGLGQYIQSGASNPVFTIGDLSTVWLIANVRETDAPLMRVGQPVEVRVLAFPGKVFKAKLTYVAPSVDPNTHRLPVRAEVENPDGGLKPEMFASFSIITGEETNRIGVPQSAVVYEGDTARVWVANADGTISARTIEAGRVNDGVVEVLSGLAAGDKIVTSGTLFIDRAATAE